MRDLHVYRAFRLDQHGHVVGADYIPADDDKEALERLGHIANSYGIELWDRARKVCVVEPTRAPLVSFVVGLQPDEVIGSVVHSVSET